MTEEDKVEELTDSQKLDKIMEAVAFQSQILVSALVAFDKQLQAKESKIIKAHGSI